MLNPCSQVSIIVLPDSLLFCLGIWVVRTKIERSWFILSTSMRSPWCFDGRVLGDMLLTVRLNQSLLSIALRFVDCEQKRQLYLHQDTTIIGFIQQRKIPLTNLYITSISILYAKDSRRNSNRKQQNNKVDWKHVTFDKGISGYIYQYRE